MSSPTQRSKAHLEAQGYLVAITENGCLAITMKNGINTVIDAGDAERVFSGNRWCASWSGRDWYFVRGGHGMPRQYLHRVIIGVEDKAFAVDHRDGDTTNNRRDNLRVCTQQQNTFNSKSRKSASGYKGVVWTPHCKKWSARITKDGKDIYLGLLLEIKDAALAYNVAAVKYFGEFARLNNV